MSHIHNIAGNQIASTEYQEYLARLSANLRAKRKSESGKEEEVRTFDSAIDPDHESDQDRGGSPDREAEDDPQEETEGEKGWSVKA
jgi:hypothetical protein